MNGDSFGSTGTLNDKRDTERFLPWGIDVSKPLPEVYGRRHVTLIMRDPRWVFAYWELPDPSGGQARVVLYETDPTGSQRRLVSRTEVPFTGRAHLPVPSGDRYYLAQLESGGVAATSNVVYTPPEGPASGRYASSRLARGYASSPLEWMHAGGREAT